MNRQKLLTITIILVVTLSMAGLSFTVSASQLAATAPGLGEAASYSVLGATEVTNSGATTANQAVGVSPGTVIDGGITAGGGLHNNDASAILAQAAALTAFGNLESQGPGSTIGSDLTGANLVPGVYTVPGVSLLSGELILNGPGVYIFLTGGLQAGGTVTLTNGARACDVYWHDTSSVNVTGAFTGTIIALTSITFGTGATLDGRALALNGNVTLLTNTFSGPGCASAPLPTETTAPSTEATATLLPGISNLPSTGGAPIQNDTPPLGLMIAVIFSAVVLALGVRAFRRLNLLK
jgi:hypothetical protein